MPFGPYKSHTHCVQVVSHKKNPPSDPHAFCRWLEKKITGGDPLIAKFLDNEEMLFSLYHSEAMGVNLLSEDTSVMKLLTKQHANQILKTPAQIRKDPDSTIIDDHRWIHWWAKALADKKELFLNREQLEKLHRIYVDEFSRRGFDHKSPLEFGALHLSASTLQELLQSREAFLVDPEFINIVGSSVSSKAMPKDVDILFRGVKSDEYGTRYLESVPENLRDNLELVWESSGPNGPYLPVYELWALPKKNIEQKEPEYKIAIFTPFKPPNPSKIHNRESIRGLLEDDYFIIAPPPHSVRLTVHRKETEIMAFDADGDEYSLPERIIEELLAIDEPKAFIIDGFLSKRRESLFEIIDMPWWRESEHVSQSTRTRFQFMFRLPTSDHVRFAPMLHFENRADTINQLKEDTAKYLVIPGSAIYSVDAHSDWMSFDGTQMWLAAGSDEQIKELVDSGKWESMTADARFKLMIKRRTVEPLYPFGQMKTTKKGYTLREVFGIKGVKGLAKELFRVPNKQSTEVKIDGFRLQVHRKGDHVKLFTESGHEITKQLPKIVADTKKLPANSVIFDSEATPYDKDLRNLGRAGAAPAFAKGAKGPVDDSLWAIHVFDMLHLNGEDLHNMPYSERRERLKGIELPVRDAPRSKEDFRIHLWENKVHLSTSAEQMVKDAAIVSKVPGSEGAMFKQWDSKYRLSGNTPLWSKMKVSYDIDSLVVGIKKEGDTYNYICAIGPITGVEEAESAPLDSAKGKKFVKWKGKIYSVIGKTFNTKTEAKLGQILRVSVKTINKIDDKVYHWFHPQVLEAREDKTTPDPLNTAETIRKASTEQRKSLSESYLIMARYGLESPLACHLSPWVALSSEEEWIYLANDDELIAKLQELEITRIVGNCTDRETVMKFAEAGIAFAFTDANTILGSQDSRPLLMDEPEMPRNASVNPKQLKGFYDLIRSDEVFHMKLECGAFVPLKKKIFLADPYLTYPDESKTWKYVIQFHVRGLSVHADFRCEISKTQLVGWTWSTGKSLIKPMLRKVSDSTLSKVGLTKSGLKDMTISEISAKLRSTSDGKKLRKHLSEKTQELSMAQLKVLMNELWNEEVEPILSDPNKKILTHRKAPEPHEWLTYSGEVPAGAVGGTAEMEGQFIIMDKGTIQFGAQKSYFHEYWINGDKIKKRRFIIRRLATRKEWGVKEAFAWLTFFTKPGERPYAISNRAVTQDWMPPQRISALPREVREQIPPDRKYWKAKNAKEIRDALVKDLKSKKVTLKLARGLQFAVKRIWHKGPEVKRGAPVVRYWILIHDGKRVLDAWDFGRDLDPLEEDGLTARRKPGKGLTEILATTGEVPATHPVSITKKLVTHHDTSDHGSIQIIADSNNLIRARFKGKTLKGLYIFLKEDPGSDMWIFKKSELPKPKKMLLSSPRNIRLAASDISHKMVGEVLFASGVAIKPGEVIGMDGKPAFFTAEGIAKFWPSMFRQPVVALHGELKGDVIGFVNKIHLNKTNGWGVVDQAIIWHPIGIKLILEKKLPDWSIELIPETVWDPEHKHDHVIGGKCIGLGAVPKGACATCHIETATMGQISPGEIFKFGLPLEDYMNQQYWESGRSTQDIADELGRPRSTIELWMDQAHIPRRNYAESRHLRMLKETEVRKFGGRVNITALGSGAFTDIPRDKCPQCEEARSGGKSKRNYTATLFSVGNEHLLINTPKGISGMLGLKKVKPNYVLIEHVHEDVIGGLHELRTLNPIVFATKAAWDYLRRHYRSLSGEKGKFEEIYPFKRYIIKDQPFKVGPFSIKAVKVQHAKPGDPDALGFRIDLGGKVIWHCSDVYRIPQVKKVLKDVDVFIGDGATLKREIVQRRKGAKAYGHTSIEKQIKWAKDAEIPRIYFTQIGHVGMTHNDLNKTLQELAPNAQALYDGAEISIGGSAPGAKHSKQIAEDLLEGKRTMIVRDKPYSEYAKQAVYLLSDDSILGLYVEGYPEGPHDANKVRREMRDEHGMTDEEWRKELAGAEEVWIYRPRILRRTEEDKKYEIPKTETPFIHDVKLRTDD